MLSSLGGFLLLAGSALADVASVQHALDVINISLLNLDKAVVGLPGSSSFVVSFGGVVVPILQNATRIITQSAPLTAAETSSLDAASAALRQNANLTINDFLARRTFFDATNFTDLVLRTLVADKAAGVAFAQALVSKFPPELTQTAGRQDVMELLNIYDRGITLFTNQGLATGVPPAPLSTATTSPSDFTPVSLPVPQVADVELNKGALSADGSCICAVQCAGGTLGMSLVP